jgi:two-component system chemotaxis family response regulator WspR
MKRSARTLFSSRALNDTFGHIAGDEALRRLADVIRTGSRQSDTAARYGGEEFAVILPATDGNGARVMAERFRRKVESAAWLHRAVTISLGIVTRVGSHPRCNAHALVMDADAISSKSCRPKPHRRGG